jgi:hypothetical protein
LPCQLCTCYVPASETTQVVTSPPRIAFREREESARLRGEKARRERKRNTAVRYARISAICALIALAKDQDLRSGIQYVVNLGQQIGAVGTNVANQPKGTDQPKDGLVAESGSGSSPEPRVTDLSIGTAATIQLDQHLGLSNTSIVSPVGTLTAVVDPIRFDQSLGLNAGILSSPVNLSIGTAGNSSIVSPAGTLTAAIDPIRLDRPLGLGAASILSSAPALSIGTAATIRLAQPLGLSNASIVSPAGTLITPVDPINRLDQLIDLSGALSSSADLTIGRLNIRSGL